MVIISINKYQGRDENKTSYLNRICRSPLLTGVSQSFNETCCLLIRILQTENKTCFIRSAHAHCNRCIIVSIFLFYFYFSLTENICIKNHVGEGTYSPTYMCFLPFQTPNDRNTSFIFKVHGSIESSLAQTGSVNF